MALAAHTCAATDRGAGWHPSCKKRKVADASGDGLLSAETVEQWLAEAARAAGDGVVSDEMRRGGRVVAERLSATTELARAATEAALRAAGRRLDLLLGNLRDYGVIYSDPRGFIVEWRAGAEAITGYSAAEAVGQAGDLIFTPEDRADGAPARELATAATVGRAEDKRWHATKGGGRFFADGVMTALRDETGALRGFAKVFRDATAQKLAEDALRVSEERLRFTLRAGRMGTWEHTIATNELVASDTCKAALGLAAGDPLTFEGLERAIVMTDRPLWRARVDEAMQHGADLSVECRVLWPDGTEHWVDVRASCSRDARGNAATIAGVLIDIDHRKAIEHELRAADQRKDEFLLTASHELRTPLNAILGWAQMLQRGGLDGPGQQRAADTIERNARAQVRLIEDILDGSRMISGKLRLDLRPLELTSLVHAAVDALRPTAEAKQIALSVVAQAGGTHVLGDPERLSQVVWNLVSNAMKFTGRGGHVEVELAHGATETEIRIRDSGEGIDVAFLPHVFERFRQADGSTTRRHGGLGLGLALVAHLVEAHGGQVRAFSGGKGQGALFTVTLPLRPPGRSVPPPAHEPGALSAAALTGIAVLVVDDETDARDLAGTILRLAGARVTLASSAAVALEEMDREVPDVLVSDVGMPEADGYALIRALRARSGDVPPAVALTAYAREEDRRLALAAGFQRHLSKPIEPALLLDAVAQLVGR